MVFIFIFIKYTFRLKEARGLFDLAEIQWLEDELRIFVIENKAWVFNFEDRCKFFLKCGKFFITHKAF